MLARNFILVVTVTAVFVLLWRTHVYTTQAAPFNISSRAPTQPSENSIGAIYYISPANLYMVVWIGTALAAIFTAARTRLQYLHNRRLYINDYLICLALVFHLILSILYQVMSPPMYSLVAAMEGLEQITASNLTRFKYYLPLQFAVTYVFWSALWSVKLALLTFFWRLFESVRTHVRPFWWVMCGVTIATWIISLFLQGFACKPVGSFFKLGKLHCTLPKILDTEKFPGGCNSPSSIYGANLAFRFSSICDIITDFLSNLNTTFLHRICRVD